MAIKKQKVAGEACGNLLTMSVYTFISPKSNEEIVMRLVRPVFNTLDACAALVNPRQQARNFGDLITKLSTGEVSKELLFGVIVEMFLRRGFARSAIHKVLFNNNAIRLCHLDLEVQKVWITANFTVNRGHSELSIGEFINDIRSAS